MDKKNLIIGGLTVALTTLTFEYVRLAADFKTALETINTNREVVETAKTILTDKMFIDIMSNYDQEG